ncbi:titan9 [Euphorbia peplus]|nr:titan9 [Euphorbia peplus]
MEIEPLYAKLYNKYKLLKEKRFAELDDISKDQEVKFLNYVNAAEDVIKHVRHENEKLRAQVSELRSEVSLIRSTKDDECEQYKNLLVEERQKNKILLEEVERLRNLQNISLHSEDGENATRQLITTELAQVTPTQVTSNSTRITRKRAREATAGMDGSFQQQVTSNSTRRTRRKHAQEANAGMDASSPRNDQDACLVRESANGSPQGALSSGDLENEKQPQCCRRIVDGSGADVEDRRHITCQFQTLIEYLLGMKLCADYQTERKSILALHESSGYSFSLTWVKNESEEGEELMYRVTRLGTFEMMAPEWMRSSLMFSTSMWPIFFERLTRTIKMGSC